MLHLVQERISRLEQALLDTERKTQVLQQFAKAGIWEFDLVKNKLWWSSEIYKIFGKDPLEFQPSFASFLACIPEDEVERVKKAYLYSLDSRATYNIVHRIVLNDGSIRFVEEHCETRFNADGKPMYSIGTCQDITEKQNAIQLIEESANRFQDMVAKAPLAYVSFDQECRITMVNERFCELIGESSESLVGKHFHQFLNKDQVEAFKKSIANSKNAEELTADFTLVRPKLGPIIVAMTVKRYTSSLHQIDEFHGILLDITYINTHQEKIKEQNQRLLDIAWSQSHILRHPVTNLLGILPLVKEELSLNKAQISLADKIQVDLLNLDTSIHRIVNKCSSVKTKV